ncbi:MAG: pentapeptide repeat-containing protein [Phycisphaerales bacterium JB052]
MTPEPPDLDEHHELAAIGPEQLAPNAAFELAELSGETQSPTNGSIHARGLAWSMCRLTGRSLMGSTLAAMRCVDCVFDRADAANATWVDARLVRCRFNACKLTGLDIRGGTLRDVAFHDCKMPDAFMPETALDRVLFESCQLSGLDLSGAKLAKVALRDCDARNLNLLGARVDTLDLRGSQIEGLSIEPRSVVQIILDPTQSPALAMAMGARILGPHEQA